MGGLWYRPELLIVLETTNQGLLQSIDLPFQRLALGYSLWPSST
jgi:hypothetical protein